MLLAPFRWTVQPFYNFVIHFLLPNEFANVCKAIYSFKSLNVFFLSGGASAWVQGRQESQIHAGAGSEIQKDGAPRHDEYNQALITCLLVSSADNFCKQFGPRSGQTKCWS